jgi:osmotically-inducible protein OsmY
MMSKLKLIVRFFMGLLLIMAIAGCAGSQKTASTGEFFDDSVLTTKVKASILGDSRLKVMQINVETFKGVVLLSGFVDSAAAAKRAVEIARTIRGVKSVNNALVVK